MKNSSLRLVVAFVFVGLVAFLWWSRSRAIEPAGLAPAPGADAGVDGARETARLSAPPPTDSATSARASTTTSDAATTIEASSGDPDAEGAWPVRVVDDAGVPRAGAVVRWAAGASYLEMMDTSHPFHDVDPSTVIRDDAPRLVTRSDGRVFLPRDALPGFVHARAGDSSSAMHVSVRPQQEIEIRLQPELALTIQVVDGEGRPVAGVPVALRGSRVEIAQPLWKGTTSGPDGIVRPRDLERRMRHARVEGRELVAWLPIPTSRIVAATIDLENPTPGPVVLTLPPCGSVEVRLLDSSGRPAVADRAQLAPVKELNPRGKLGYESDSFDPVELERGRAFWPFVEIGLALHAEARVAFEHPSVDGPGPTRIGERVVLDLDLGAPRWRLVGRLVDADKVPVANAVLDGSLSYGSGGGAQGSYGAPFGRTGADGWFEHDLPLPLPDTGAVTVSVRFARPDGNGWDEAVTTIEAPIPRGDVDLGVLVVSTPVVLARVHVVDESDAPLGNVLVGATVPMTLPRGGEAWSSDPRMRVEKDGAEGVFRVQGTVAPARMRIVASKLGYVQAHVCEISRGASEARIVLERAATIRGRVLADDASTLGRLRVVVVRPTDDDATRAAFRITEERHVTPDGSFVFDSLRRGTVDVEFRVPGGKSPVHAVRGVDLREPGAARDPRLAEIDLRGLVPPAPPVPTSPAGAPR